jgi:hypothetical protein
MGDEGVIDADDNACCCGRKTEALAVAERPRKATARDDLKAIMACRCG